MKKITLYFLLLFIIPIAYSQKSGVNFDKYDFEKGINYADAEADVIKTANFLLFNPIDKYVPERENAAYFLADWMTGTPDYDFGTGNLEKMFDDNTMFTGISMAAQVKYCIENKIPDTHSDQALLAIFNTISDYFGNPVNNVKLTKKLKELVDAKNKGHLKEFLDKENK